MKVVQPKILGQKALESHIATLVLGAVCLFVLFGIWHRIGPVFLPPDVTRFLEQDSAFVITYHDGCTCGSDVEKWLDKAQKLKKPVLLIARENSSSVKDWKNRLSPNLFVDTEGRTFRKYSIDKLTTFNVVSKGDVIFQSNKDTKVSEYLNLKEVKP